jgi:hypothetical protein
LQQVAGAIPEELGHYEMPPNGYGGNLWQSGKRANALHDFFLNSSVKHLPLPSPVVETTERVSINFISWLGKDLRHMGIRRISDELALTIQLPAFLNRPIAIYSDFTVSHLSFGPQEEGLDVDRLINAYGDLMKERLSA